MERLPIVISSSGITKLLCVPKLDNGIGKVQAETIFEAAQEWGISRKIKGLCCDTTPSNLGVYNGAAVLLEQLLKCNFQYFSCRHQVMEVILRNVYEVCIPGTNGPYVHIFSLSNL